METIVDIIIIVIYVMLAAAVASVIWSMINGWRKRSKTLAEERLAKRTSVLVCVLTVVIVAVSLLFSSSEPLKIAGKMYTDTLWLRMADMFVFSIVLLLIAFVVLAIVVGAFGSTKKKLR